jgi:glycosyltransferase involved in cell wall biosynthesis
MIASCHIVGGKSLGGAELFFVRLVNALAVHGHCISAITVKNSGVAARLEPTICQRHVPMRTVWDFESRWQISRILREHPCDIVQTYMGRATRLTHLSTKQRPVHLARLGGYYDLHGFRHAHAWIAASPGIADHLIKNGFPANRVFHLSNFVPPHTPSTAVELQHLRQELAIPTEAFIIAAVGRLHPVKGFDDLLTAFASVSTTIHQRPVYLILVGDGPLAAQLQKYARQLGIEQRVRWPGWRDDAGRFQELADLCLFTSREEGLGNVILETWARKKAIISTRAQGPLDTITHQHDGWLTPIADPKALAATIELLLQDEDLRCDLAANGHHTLLTRHSEAAIIAGYLDLYDKILTT